MSRAPFQTRSRTLTFGPTDLTPTATRLTLTITHAFYIQPRARTLTRAHDHMPYRTGHDTTSRSTTEALRGWFIREFQTAARFCGLSTAEIQSHSLRSGGATAYLQAGADPYIILHSINTFPLSCSNPRGGPQFIIQRMGRWRSWCWMMYTWASTLHIQNAMESIATCNHNANPVNLDEVRW